jgi:hypothetical protein
VSRLKSDGRPSSAADFVFGGYCFFNASLEAVELATRVTRCDIGCRTPAYLPRPTDSANAFRTDDHRLAALFGEGLDLERRGRPTADLFEEKS